MKIQNGSYENAIAKMTEQIQKLGGVLHFTIEKSADGWVAQCREAEGIIAGGQNQNPSEFEIESQIREAMYAAFHIPAKVSPEVLKSSVSALTLSIA